MDDKKLMDTIEKIPVPRNYDMRTMDPVTIWNATNGEWYRAISYGFRYGFQVWVSQRQAGGNGRNKKAERKR